LPEELRQEQTRWAGPNYPDLSAHDQLLVAQFPRCDLLDAGNASDKDAGGKRNPWMRRRRVDLPSLILAMLEMFATSPNAANATLLPNLKLNFIRDIAAVTFIGRLHRSLASVACIGRLPMSCKSTCPFLPVLEFIGLA